MQQILPEGISAKHPQPTKGTIVKYKLAGRDGPESMLELYQ